MFIAIPVGMNYRAERLPLVTFSLIGINTLIWLISAICLLNTRGESEEWIYDHLWLTPASGVLYQYFTSMFVHEGIFHLAGNMLYLFLFGACVEDIIGRWRFAIFYLVGGLVADLAFIAMTPEHFSSEIPLGGASGAIAACMGMYLLLRADADIEIKYFLWLYVYIRAGEFEIPAWVAIAVWFGLNLLSAVLTMISGGNGGGVAFGAHVGGFLAGLALIAGYRRFQRPSGEEPAPTSTLIIDPAKILAVPAKWAPVPVSTETPTIYLHDGQQQTGPFTLTHVQAMLKHGEIGRDASYWSDGMDDWQSVVDLAGQPID
jgi:membrane associated rhomboid family serine protease